MDDSPDIGFTRCPNCQALIADLNEAYISKCPSCGKEISQTLTSIESIPPKKYKPTLYTPRNIILVFMVIVSIVLYLTYVAIFVGPQVGDNCKPRDGLLCDEQYCGGDFFDVDPYEQCEIIGLSEDNRWYYLSCPNGQTGWTENCR